jgi:hypothetical protein
MFTSRFCAAFAALLTLCLASSAHAYLVTNGSFESGLADWTTGGGVPADTTGAEGMTDGTLALILGAASGGAAGDTTVEQILTTVIGAQYVLDFDYGAFGASATQSMQVEAIGSSSVLDETVSDTGAGFGAAGFEHYQYNFTADSTTTTLRFSDVSPAGGASIDGVLDLVTVVPEPSTVALLGLGLIALASVDGRRRIRR